VLGVSIRPVALKGEILGAPWPGSGRRGFGGFLRPYFFLRNLLGRLTRATRSSFDGSRRGDYTSRSHSLFVGPWVQRCFRHGGLANTLTVGH